MTMRARVIGTSMLTLPVKDERQRIGVDEKVKNLQRPRIEDSLEFRQLRRIHRDAVLGRRKRTL